MKNKKVEERYVDYKSGDLKYMLQQIQSEFLYPKFGINSSSATKYCKLILQGKI